MRLRILLLPAVAAVALLAGCTQLPLGGPGSTPTPASNGVEAEDPDEILARATEATANAESVHVSGTIGEGVLGTTVELTFAGQNVTGTANIFGVVATVTRVGSAVYLKADTSLFAQFLPPDQQDSLSDLDGKWFKVDLAMVEAFMPISFSVADLALATAPLTKGDLTTVGGTPAITLTDADGAVLHVATVGEPYLLDISLEGDRDLTFSRFGEEVTIEAPPADEVVDLLAELGLG